MARKFDTVKLNIPGGVIAANDLNNLLSVLAAFGIHSVRFGVRQQLFVRLPIASSGKLQAELESKGYQVETNRDAYPNIVSSYVCQDIFNSSTHLSEGVYRDVLDSFTHKPSLKINFVDGSQSFVPFFTGNLNFISSVIPNYWHLQVRFPKTNKHYSWPGLVYSLDIARLSSVIEKVLKEQACTPGEESGFLVDEFYKKVLNSGTFIMQSAPPMVVIPEFKLPYYEGFNQSGPIHWLGIYRRDESFPVDFLRNLCLLSLHCRIAQIYLTPWKSLIIKNLDPSFRKLWDGLLGKYRINVRHASNELNWQVEDHCEEALALKRALVLHFDREDIRTYGLCFAIKTKPRTGLFGSVIIRKQSVARKKRELFEILYTRDFNPNSPDLVVFRKDLPREMIATYLVSLCKYYYERLDQHSELLDRVFQEGTIRQEVEVRPERILHQCQACFSVYDPFFGDELGGVAPGVSFVELPETHACSTCGSPKSLFEEIGEGVLCT